MKNPKRISFIIDLAKPIVEEQKLMLWDLALEKEGSDWYLRVFLDGNRPITLDDCEAVSRKLDKLLDEHDPIDHPYYLEVSSAGISRNLKKPWHYSAYIGKQIEILLIRPINGERNFTGTLKDFTNNIITLEIDKKEIEINTSETSYVKTKENTIR